MKSRYSKKNKRQMRRRKFVTRRRMRGGDGNGDGLIHNVEELKKLEKTLKHAIEIEEQKQPSSLMTVINSAVEKTGDFVEPYVEQAKEAAKPYIDEAIVDTSEALGDLVDVDPENKQEVKEKLDDIVEVVNSPEVKEKIEDIVEGVSENAAVVIKASEPAVKQLTKTTMAAFGESGSEIGKAAVKIGLNMAEEIPVLGAGIALLRSADAAAKAGLSVVDSGSEIVEATSDAVKETIDNLDGVKDENLGANQDIEAQIGGSYKRKQNMLRMNINDRNKMLAKVGGSIKEFHDSTMNPYKIINKVITTGGKTKKMRKHNLRGRTRHRGLN